jgi:FkbM family methyltransferase
MIVTNHADKEIPNRMATLPSWLQHPEPSHYIAEADLPFKLRLLRWLGHLRWMPRGQDRLLRFLLHPDKCPHFFFEIDFFGLRYRGDLAHFVDWMVFFYGSSAMPELTLLERSVGILRSKKQGSILCLDIGANVGQHTLFMAGIADRVIAFEPFPPLLELIRQKIALNNIENVTLMPFGLGEKDDVLDYFPAAGSNSGAGSFCADSAPDVTRSVQLQIKHGDPLLEQLGTEHIDVMKVDVEGFETSVFRGLKRHIQRDRPIILTEVSNESRKRFGSEQAFRQAFYPDALFFEVTGRYGHNFTLRRFEYESTEEVLIIPGEMQWLRDALM